MSFAIKIENARKEKRTDALTGMVRDDFKTLKFAFPALGKWLADKYNQGRPFTLYEAEKCPLVMDNSFFYNFEASLRQKKVPEYTFNELKYFKNMKTATNSQRLSSSGLTEISFPDMTERADRTLSPGLLMFSTNLRKVVLPDGLEEIPPFMFVRCESLVEISIPDSVMDIRDYAFSQCTSLKGIKLPESLKRISSYAFYACDNLEGITVPDSVEHIEKSAFSDCPSLKDVKLPDGIRIICDKTFENCKGLEKITLPRFVYLVMADAFAGCKELNSVYLNSEVEFTEGWIDLGHPLDNKVTFYIAREYKHFYEDEGRAKVSTLHKYKNKIVYGYFHAGEFHEV